MKNEKLETRKLNVTYDYRMVASTVIDVPKNLSLEEAIEYAKNKIELLPMQASAEYMSDSCVIEEELCNFEE